MKCTLSTFYQFELVRAGNGTTIRRFGQYLIHVDFYGLCLYKAMEMAGTDVNSNGYVRIMGMDDI
jgi:hypothetical protein